MRKTPLKFNGSNEYNVLLPVAAYCYRYLSSCFIALHVGWVLFNWRSPEGDFIRVFRVI